MAEKSKDAFRTISEVAEWLDVPTHVLRFWESRFAQIKPVKRAGGRRYYRPSDMRVIGGVKVLLHDQGMTIRGVQKLFREEGIKHVSGFSPDLFDEDEDLVEAAPLDAEALELAARPAPAARMTHSAEPAAVEAKEPEHAAAEPTEEAGPVFRTRSRTTTPVVPADEPDEKEPELSFTPEPKEAEPDTGADEPSPIPPTPDVPEIDPADDDKIHDVGPGRATRLRQVPRELLRADRTRIEAVVARLKTILDKSA